MSDQSLTLYTAPCTTEHGRPGRESFRIRVTESGVRIETPSIFTNTYWTREQLLVLREAVDAVLAKAAGGSR